MTKVHLRQIVWQNVDQNREWKDNKQCLLMCFVFTSENEISGVIYCLFRGRKTIFLIFSTKLEVKCATKFENRLTNTKVMSRSIFEQDISIKTGQWWIQKLKNTGDA